MTNVRCTYRSVFVMEMNCVLCEVATDCLCMGYVDWSLKAVPWHRRSVAGRSPRRPGLDPGVSPCEFLVGKVALWQLSVTVLRFSLVSIIPAMPHTHLYLNITVIRRISGQNLGNLRKQDIREHVDWKGLFYGLQRFRGISTLSTSGNYVYRVINIRWHVRSAFVWFVWRSGHTAIFSPISSVVNGWMFVMNIRGSLWGEN
jgi:hypothetical protein